MPRRAGGAGSVGGRGASPHRVTLVAGECQGLRRERPTPARMPGTNAGVASVDACSTSEQGRGFVGEVFQVREDVVEVCVAETEPLGEGGAVLVGRRAGDPGAAGGRIIGAAEV